MLAKPLRFEWGEHSRTQRSAVVLALGEHTPLLQHCQCEAHCTRHQRHPHLYGYRQNTASMLLPAVSGKLSLFLQVFG
jgi:hypothetical protein